MIAGFAVDVAVAVAVDVDFDNDYDHDDDDGVLWLLCLSCANQFDSTLYQQV